ncbi:hypothetical protein [Rickettsia endosymbiont of Aspidapion aeneum]
MRGGNAWIVKASFMSFPRGIVVWFQIPRYCEEGRSPDVAIQEKK